MVSLSAFVPLNPLTDPGQFFKDGIKGFATQAVDMLHSSFTTSDLSPNWWISVVGGTVRTHVGGAVSTTVHPGMLNELVLIMAPVLVLLAAVQIGISIFRQSSIGVIRAGVAAVFAIPATYILAGVMYMLITIFDYLSVFILQAGNSGTDDDAISGVLAMFGISWDTTSKQAVMDENYQQWAMATDSGQVLAPLVLIFVIWVIALILAGFLIFRLMALMVLTSVMPVVVMSQALEGAKGLLKGFTNMVVALLIAKPFAAVVLKLGMVVSATAGSTWQFLAGMIALLMAAVMPVMTMKLMSFVGGGAGEGVMGGGVHIAQKGLGAARGAGRSAKGMGRGAVRSASRVAIAPLKAGRR